MAPQARILGFVYVVHIINYGVGCYGAAGEFFGFVYLVWHAREICLSLFMMLCMCNELWCGLLWRRRRQCFGFVYDVVHIINYGVVCYGAAGEILLGLCMTFRNT